MKGRIVQRSPGRWQLIYDLPRGANGKRKQKYATVKGTEREAQRELRRRLAEVDSGLVVDSSKDTVGEYLDKWLLRIKGKVEPTTYDNYACTVRAHLIPHLGNRRLDTLKPEHVADFITFLEREGNRTRDKDGKPKGTPLAGITIFRIASVLKQGLGEAVELGLLARNPAKVKLPPARPKKKRILKDEDVLAVVQGVRDAHLKAWCPEEQSYLYMLIVLALATGCRRGELLGLKWSDVNLVTGTTNIERSLSEVETGEGKEIRVKVPKTEAGERSIVLPDFARRALTQHKGRQAERRLLLGKLWRDHDLIICGPDGSPLRPSTVSQRMKQMMDNLGFERVTLHGLRHTYASMAISNGANLKTLQTIMGHSNVKMTIGTYGHLMGGEQEEVARGIDTRIGKVMGL